MFPRRSRPQPQKDPSESTPLDPGMHDRHDIPNMQETPGDDGNTATPSSVPPFSSAGTSHRTPASSSHHNNNDEESPAAPKRRRFDVGPPPRREPTNMCADILAGVSMIMGFLHLSGTGGGGGGAGHHAGFGDRLHNWSVVGSTLLGSGNYYLTRQTKSLIYSNQLEIWKKLHGVHQDVLQELEEARTGGVTLLIKVNEFKTEINENFNEFKTEINENFNEFKTEINEKLDNLSEDFKGFKDQMEFVVEYIRRTDSTSTSA